MIRKTCETCESAMGCNPGLPCDAPTWSQWRPGSAALEARIVELEEALTRLAAEAEKVINDVIAKATDARMERELMRAACASEMRELIAVYRGNGNDLGVANAESRLRALLGDAKDGGAL